MNVKTRIVRVASAPWHGVKAFTRMVFSGWGGSRGWFVGNSARRYHAEVGDGTSNSAVQATLSWIARTFPEAPTALWKKVDNDEEMISEHPMLELLHRPNPYYAGETLWAATLFDYHTDGNGYWLKLRLKNRKVVQLWWVPHFQMTPKRSADGEFISYYEYTPGGTAAPIRVEVDDVVHFRNGLDPDNPMLGRAPMRSVLAEVFTDMEAANYTATILKNSGVPGIVLSPDNADIEISPEDVKAAKQQIIEEFSGDNRGRPLVFGSKTSVQQFGFSPQQMDLRTIRRLPEERITAVLGVAAIVTGLGAGLDRSTFANFAEAREASYESRIIPDQRILGAELRFQLLPDFESQPMLFRVGFDLSGVRVLQEDEDKLTERISKQYASGLIMRSEGRRALGYNASEDDDVYAVPISTVLTPEAEAGATALALPPAGATGNGTGAPADALAAIGAAGATNGQ